MSRYNSIAKEVTTMLPVKEGDWAIVDCGCCAGLQWGGEEPRECRDCDGSGVQWINLDSGVVRKGMLLNGSIPKEELRELRRQLNVS